MFSCEKMFDMYMLISVPNLFFAHDKSSKNPKGVDMSTVIDAALKPQDWLFVRNNSNLNSFRLDSYSSHELSLIIYWLNVAGPSFLPQSPNIPARLQDEPDSMSSLSPLRRTCTPSSCLSLVSTPGPTPESTQVT